MFDYQVIGVLFLATAIGSVPVKPRSLHPDVGLDISELAAKYGYPLESHEFETEDGYILTLHRIPSNSTSDTKSPVLLMHGLLSSSVDWINMGPGVGLGFLLSDNGYDVWMGNQRGNTWSRKHKQLDPDTDAEQFFDFSFHEIGYYDLPAKIDYILNLTGKEKINYVGHSQGTTTFFIMGAERPEYNDKIKLMAALAPVAFMDHIPNPFVKIIVEYLDVINELVEILKIHEFLPHFETVSEIGSVFCSDESEYQDVCVWFLNLICGFDWEIDPNFIPVITSNAPAGSSIRQLQHYGQQVRSKRFAQYDYGAEGNLAKYGSEVAPLYNPTKITAPVSLYYANNDWLAAVEDVVAFSQLLPNLANLHKVPLDQFNHLDFLWAQHVATLLYNDLIAEMNSLN